MKQNYFTFEELVHSVTADAAGVSNLPTTPQQLYHLYTLWKNLNRIRRKLGMPIFVSSAFRTPEVNTAVGGAERSLHLRGRAADISCNDMDKLRAILHDEEWAEFLDYGTFIHIAI